MFLVVAVGRSAGFLPHAVFIEQTAEAREQLEQGKPTLDTLHRTLRWRQKSHAFGSRPLSMANPTCEEEGSPEYSDILANGTGSSHEGVCRGQSRNCPHWQMYKYLDR